MKIISERYNLALNINNKKTYNKWTCLNCVQERERVLNERNLAMVGNWNVYPTFSKLYKDAAQVIRRIISVSDKNAVEGN